MPLRPIRSFPFEADWIRYRKPAELTLYRNDEAVGPAFLARAEVLPPEIAEDPALALSRLLAPDFDWKTRALVEEPNPYEGAALDKDVKPGLSVESRGYGRWLFKVASPEPSVLVLGQSYYPGWRATVDGAPRKTIPADWTLTGVFLEPGKHVVEFQYCPVAFSRGAAVSAISALLFALAVAGLSLRKRPAS